MPDILQFQCTELSAFRSKREEARLEVLTADLLDDTRKIRKLQTEKGTFLEIPVTEAAGEKSEIFR